MREGLGAEGFGAPDVADEFVAGQVHAGVDAVGGGEDVAGGGESVGDGVASGVDALLVGAGLEEAAVDVAAEGDLVGGAADDVGHIHAALGVEGVEGVGFGGQEAVEDGEDVAIGMFDDVEAQVAVGLGDFDEVGGDEAVEPVEGEEGAGVEAVVGAEGEAVEAAVFLEELGFMEVPVEAIAGLLVDFFGFFVHAEGEIQRLHEKYSGV